MLQVHTIKTDWLFSQSGYLGCRHTEETVVWGFTLHGIRD